MANRRCRPASYNAFVAGVLKLTPAVADAIVEAVRRGVPASTAARAAGISDATVLDWLEAPITGRWRSGAEVSDASLAQLIEFRTRVEQAVAEFEQESIAAIAEAGRITGKSGVPEWRALAWLHNNHPAYRSRYKHERSFSVDGEQRHSVTHVHTLVREMPDALVRRALGSPDEGGVDR
jgi:hypothetical protein